MAILPITFINSSLSSPFSLFSVLSLRRSLSLLWLRARCSVRCSLSQELLPLFKRLSLPQPFLKMISNTTVSYVSQDMSLPHQIVPSLIFKSLKSPWQLCRFNPRSEPSQLIHTVIKPTAPNNVVKAICNAFRSGWTWDTLSREFHNIEFNEQFVEKIILELEQPIDAKWALGFFHWAAQSKFPTLPSVLLLSHSHLSPSSADLER
ncbi:hypothetical protein L484_006749 [Morus notabilis]|uniref:Uncharacterized protein n=1 Tax=Morus notabilis TaxID=981085 RepID=W9RVY1_9ROSA|nr:hypothetical protein L484_006749 [Morus notabilis]